MLMPSYRVSSENCAPGALLLVLLFAIVTGCSRSPSEPVEIKAAITVQLGPGDVQSTQLQAAGDQVVRITAMQHGIDVRLGTITDNESPLQFVDSPLQRNATEYLTVRVPDTGLLTITVASIDEDYVHGSAHLTFHVLPQTSDADRELVAAEIELTTTELLAYEEVDWEVQADSYERIAQRFEYLNLDARAADLLMRAAKLRYSQLLQWNRSALLAGSAQRHFRRIGDERNSALALALQGSAFIELVGEADEPSAKGLPDKTEQLLQQALSTLRKLDDIYNSAQVANNIGLLHYYLGNYDRSAEHYEHAHTLFTSISETKWQVITLQNLLLQDFELRRDVANAPARYDQLLDLISRTKDQELYVDILNNAALANTILGDLTAAVRQYEQALALWENHVERGRIYEGLASMFLRGGDLERAGAFLEAAIPLLRAANDHRGLASSQLLLGNVYRSTGQLDKAIDAHRYSLAAYRSAYRQTQARIELARDQLAAGNSTAAMEQINAIEVANEPITSPDIGASLFLLRAAMATATNNHKTARNLIGKGRTLAEQYGLWDRLFDVQIALADSFEAEGDRTNMREALNGAVAVLEDARLRIGSPQLRATLVAEHGDPYDRLIASYLDEHAEDSHSPAARLALESALQIIEQSRSRVFHEQIQQKTTAAADKKTISAAMAKHERLIYEYASGRSNDTELGASKEEIARIAARLLAASTTELGDDQRSNTIAAVQQRLASGEVILSYWHSDNYSKLIAIRSDALTLTSLPDIDSIANEVERVSSYLSSPRTAQFDYDGELAELRTQLLPEGVVTNYDTRVYVQADGVLHAIPFQLLVGDNKAVARVVSIFPNDGAKRVEHGQSLVLAYSGAESPSDFDVTVTRGAASSLSALPYVKEEVDALRTYMDRNRTVFRLEDDATRASLLDTSGELFDTIHIAAHALANPVMPGLSWIQLADGKVFSAEIEQTVLPARLVVLSACESGLGRNIDREGVFGLTRSFLVAGADNVVASLWPVSDRATAQLFRDFYRFSRTEEKSVAESLRLAQNQVRGIARWRHPYYWSGFEVWLRTPFGAPHEGEKK